MLWGLKQSICNELFLYVILTVNINCFFFFIKRKRICFFSLDRCLIQDSCDVTHVYQVAYFVFEQHFKDVDLDDLFRVFSVLVHVRRIYEKIFLPAFCFLLIGSLMLLLDAMTNYDFAQIHGSC